MAEAEISILVVEDNPQELRTLMGIIRSRDIRCMGVGTLTEAQKLLKTHSFSHAITDIHLKEELSDEDYCPAGLVLLREIKLHYPEITAVAVSSDPNLATFEKALAYGAKQYLRKPIQSWDEIAISLNLADKQKRLETMLRRDRSVEAMIPEELRARYPDGLVIEDGLRRSIAAIARRHDVNLILKGETGTGKEEVAKLLHRERMKATGKDLPFVAVNCSHLEGSLAQAKLFGHVKGAFTGADKAANGYIGDANGGILFLDEVHHLDLTSQKMLLRVLNDGSYHRVGETRDRQSVFQLVVATTKDLDEMVEEGLVMEDVRSRLFGHEILLKPLRERTQEIPAMARMFFHREKIELSEQEFVRIVAKLQQYYWQGNIRTLFSVLRNLILDCDIAGKAITADAITERPPMHPPRRRRGNSGAAEPGDMMASAVFNMATQIQDSELTLQAAMRELEKSVLDRVLRMNSTIAAAAEKMGVPRATLDAKRRKYGV